MRDDAASGLPCPIPLESGERLLWSGQPTPAGLFFANLSGLLSNLIWAALAATAFVYAVTHRQALGFALGGVFMVLIAVGLVRQAGEATAGRHLHYLITDRRIVSVDDRHPEKAFIIDRRQSEEADRRLWGEARRGRTSGGRASLRIPYRHFELGIVKPRYETGWFRMVRVAEPDAAFAALRPGRTA
jgi:hypothetical protein